MLIKLLLFLLLSFYEIEWFILEDVGFKYFIKLLLLFIFVDGWVVLILNYYYYLIQLWGFKQIIRFKTNIT